MRLSAWIGMGAVAGLSLAAGVRAFAPPAPVPAVFEGGLTLDQAMDLGSREGRPVFAVASADWCGACQAYKRGALADERVRAAIDAGAVPVYIDVDASPGEAQRLGASVLPASYLIRDGRVIGRFSGAASASDVLGWLKQSGVGAPAGATAGP